MDEARQEGGGVHTEPILVARELALRAGDRRLWNASSFELYEGERALLVGPSGAGKSLLGDLLLGFAGLSTPGLEIDGALTLEGVDRLIAAENPAILGNDGVGAVFQMQRSGLFDDLTIEQNLRFGSRDTAARARVCAKLGLSSTERSVTLCSGGEGVRVGIARTLLHGADVIVYDEPTTGLDPVNVRQVVAAIDASHRRLSLIISHDYAAFADHIDVVLFLDPSSRTLRRLAPSAETFEQIHRALASSGEPPREELAERPSLRSRLAHGWRRACLGTAEILLDAWALLLVPFAFLRITHPLDGPRVRQALRRDLAPGVITFVGLSAILVAMTGTYFLFERLPKRLWTEPLIQEDILTGLGLILVRVGLPLLVSVLLAAKLGAAAAAQLGHMSRTRQLDALVLLDVPRRRHLLLPTAAGQLASSWVSVVVAIGLAYVTCLAVFLASHPGFSARYFHAAYLREIDASALLWVLAKVAVSALGVAAVAYRVGTAPKRAPHLVIKGIHRTLLRALLLVLAVHALFAFLEF